MPDQPNPLPVAIRVAEVSLIYGGAQGHKALDKVSIDIFENEFFTLLGPSGCGKTTLLRLIAGFEQNYSGTLLIDGVSLLGKMPFQRPVNTVFQSYALFPHMTVAQNVGFGLEMQGKSAPEIAREVDRMLALVRLSDLGGRKPSQLSGGQQQRVALARALATRPRVLLLDESLSALDQQLRKEMQLELKRLQRETGITFVFVTHDQEEALTMSDRIAVMRGGRVQQIGTPTEIYDLPANRFVAGFIGETNLLQAQATPDSLDFGDAGRCPPPDTTWHGAVTLAVRPERLHLCPVASVPTPPNAEAFYLQGRVHSAVFMGHDTRYNVLLPGQPHLCQVRAPNIGGAQQAFQVGQAVGVGMDTRALRRLAD